MLSSGKRTVGNEHSSTTTSRIDGFQLFLVYRSRVLSPEISIFADVVMKRETQKVAFFVSEHRHIRETYRGRKQHRDVILPSRGVYKTCSLYRISGRKTYERALVSHAQYSRGE